MKPWEMRRRFALASGGTPSNPDLPWTALQIHFDGTTLVDSSPAPKSVVQHGNATLSTSGPSPKFGTRCMRTDTGLDGAGMFCENDGLIVGTGDFCYEFWVNPDSIPPDCNLLDTRSTSTGAGGFQIYYHPSYGLLHYSALGGGIHSDGTPLVQGVWQHVEYSRTSGTSYLFHAGVELVSWADSNDYSNDQLFLGGVTYTPVGAVATIGAFDEFRLLVGKGGHTADFTPPTAAYSDT